MHVPFTQEIESPRPPFPKGGNALDQQASLSHLYVKATTMENWFPLFKKGDRGILLSLTPLPVSKIYVLVNALAMAVCFLPSLNDIQVQTPQSGTATKAIAARLSPMAFNPAKAQALTASPPR